MHPDSLDDSLTLSADMTWVKTMDITFEPWSLWMHFGRLKWKITLPMLLQRGSLRITGGSTLVLVTRFSLW